jgi:TonB family protein
MSPTDRRPADAGKQGDLLLWVAGGGVAAVGVTWLVISQLSSSGSQQTVALAPNVAATATELAIAEELVAAAPAPTAAATATLDDPLKMAQLAYDAGMLTEPDEYSAWTMYARVLNDDPSSAAAFEGLTKVAEELIRRGETALEQGRFDDARATTARILAVLPNHEGAQALAARIRPDVRAPTPLVAEEFRPELTAPDPIALVAPIVEAPPEPAPAPEPPPAVDPVVEASEAFERAMSESRLLTPAGESAKHFVGVLNGLEPDHALTRDARERLAAELLSRARQSLEALDIDAADVWIVEAELLDVDRDSVKAAREAWTQRLVAMEEAKPLPASALKVVNYVVPEYPPRALERGIQGWVDIEFTVTTDGATSDVRVADGSHESYFRREAVAAVEQWRFEPRVFMGRAIEQRSYSRIRFVN